MKKSIVAAVVYYLLLSLYCFTFSLPSCEALVRGEVRGGGQYPTKSVIVDAGGDVVDVVDVVRDLKGSKSKGGSKKRGKGGGLGTSRIDDFFVIFVLYKGLSRQRERELERDFPIYDDIIVDCNPNAILVDPGDRLPGFGGKGGQASGAGKSGKSAKSAKSSKSSKLAKSAKTAKSFKSSRRLQQERQQSFAARQLQLNIDQCPSNCCK